MGRPMIKVTLWFTEEEIDHMRRILSRNQNMAETDPGDVVEAALAEGFPIEVSWSKEES